MKAYAITQDGDVVDVELITREKGPLGDHIWVKTVEGEMKRVAEAYVFMSLLSAQILAKQQRESGMIEKKRELLSQHADKWAVVRL